ncbi:Cytochrome P450 monooxygenase TRI13 [Cladobotryum mycophilum]|uniref:Cytochrome P450 monooxygenase TRI13 n=1 Tax=Cladobotryum mycophilum TaxID=491253 RepID=A0ABR0STF8_9HYPO
MDVFDCSRGIVALPMIGLAAAALLYFLYNLALPKPLPGIPYSKEASRRLFGDVKEMRKAKYRRQWVWSQPREHHAPVVQLFLFPFRRPSVVVTDYYEAVDICSRRLKEFDRGTRNKECVGLMAPNFHFTMESRDPRLSYHRDLIRDLMTPKFLNEVSAPRVYERVVALIELWDLKTTKACGRPFSANHDLYLATLDIISSVAFDMEDENTALRHEIAHVQSLNHGVSRVLDDPVEFPPGPTDPEVEALLNIPEMVSIAQASPFPTFSQMVAMLKPKHAQAQWNRHALIKRQTDRSLRKLAATGSSGCESALDQLIWREMNAAKKAGRAANYYSPEIRDEVLGYLLAGHDTTATVTSWWIKYMTRHQSVQERLRNELRQAHSNAHQEGRWPTKDEVCAASIPYFYAVMEETLRYSSVATLIIRTATCDTQILGYPIPKGTDVILPLRGPSVTEPAVPISDASRPSSYKDAKERIPYWGDDVDQFKPERWLKTSTNSDGTKEEVYDANAGPNLAFSAGPRQCFGKRLAYLELKIIMTILLWNFEFEPMNDTLNSSEITERLVNLPKDCYAKLKRL